MKLQFLGRNVPFLAKIGVICVYLSFCFEKKSEGKKAAKREVNCSKTQG